MNAIVKTPFPEFPGYPRGVIPTIDRDDQKPLNKIVNKMMKTRKLPRRGLRHKHKKPKFY